MICRGRYLRRFNDEILQAWLVTLSTTVLPVIEPRLVMMQVVYSTNYDVVAGTAGRFAE